MEVGGRRPDKIISAVFKAKHYKAFWRSLRIYDKPFKRNLNYLTSGGNYPCDIELRLNGSKVRAHLGSFHDLLTVNEIFCRQDYPVSGNEKVIVDIGSNIGISALYFLAAAPIGKVYLFEPNPSNLAVLKENTRPFQGRVRIDETAVSDTAGELDFGIEESGRYGGLGLHLHASIKVKCRHINDVLDEILSENEAIDILKLDTEGAEIPSINAIEYVHLKKIRKIYFEEGIADRLKLLSPEVLEVFHLTSRDNGHYLIQKHIGDKASSS